MNSYFSKVFPGSRVYFRNARAVERSVTIGGKHPALRSNNPRILDSHSIYLLLLVYGASTATTTLPCITTILFASSITSEQRGMLLACYAPYLLMPLIMTVDMANRVNNLINPGSWMGTGVKQD
jgi:hypothetical protein